ncbi:hypothetical protein E2C01_001160 [Portunus trituberculatus]|uniref:Uncharacterized protein n=1 Tax=Portunus trituberculatus TaxID=210409 RepID=A0A5B7CG04_PORTR|nr:hypothetical protein [Portunus trituberculatus]
MVRQEPTDYPYYAHQAKDLKTYVPIYTYLASKITKGKGRQDPALPIKAPLVLIGHGNNGKWHEDSVCCIDEVGNRAQHHYLGLVPKRPPLKFHPEI